MEEIISRVKNWNLGKKESPSVLQFNILKGCNQNCRFCNIHIDEKNVKAQSLEYDEYYRIIKEAADMGVDEIRLCGGGEPFFKKEHAMKMIELIKKNDMKCRAITNGTMLDEKDIKKLVEMGIEDIQFSIHGPDSETHDYLVGLEGAFEKTISNLKYFKYWKNKLGKKFPEISVYFILNKRNYKKLKGIKNVFPDLGISRFGIYDLDMRSEQCNELKLTQIEKNSVKKDILELKKIFENKGISFYFQETIFCEFERKNNDKKETKITRILNTDILKYDLLNVPCYEPWYYLSINEDGSVWQCPNIGDFNLNIKNKSLARVWHSNEMERIRNRVMKKELKGDCSFCCFTEITIPVREALKKLQKDKEKNSK